MSLYRPTIINTNKYETKLTYLTARSGTQSPKRSSSCSSSSRPKAHGHYILSFSESFYYRADASLHGRLRQTS